MTRWLENCFCLGFFFWLKKATAYREAELSRRLFFSKVIIYINKYIVHVSVHACVKAGCHAVSHHMISDISNQAAPLLPLLTATAPVCIINSSPLFSCHSLVSCPGRIQNCICIFNSSPPISQSKCQLAVQNWLGDGTVTASTVESKKLRERILPLGLCYERVTTIKISCPKNHVPWF